MGETVNPRRKTTRGNTLRKIYEQGDMEVQCDAHNSNHEQKTNWKYARVIKLGGKVQPCHIVAD